MQNVFLTSLTSTDDATTALSRYAKKTTWKARLKNWAEFEIIMGLFYLLCNLMKSNPFKLKARLHDRYLRML